MGTAETPTAAERCARADLWLDDLRWHRKMFRESRFRWTAEHVMAIVTRYTGGQLSFTTVEHLEQLQAYQLELLGYSSRVRNALAQPLRRSDETLGGHWERTSASLGLSLIECKATVWFAVGSPPEERTNVNVERVLRRLPFANPLIEAWELKQLWRMYEAAADVFEGIICDLVEELQSRRPAAVLVNVTATGTPSGLEQRVVAAREDRGGVGDPRRVPVQRF